MSKSKIILIILVLIAAVGGFTGYRMWNKKAPLAEDQKAMVVNADAMFTAFSTDEQKANATYLNQVIETEGDIQELSKNQAGKDVAVLKVDDPLGGVQCTFRDAVTLQMGQHIKVKGFCNGYTSAVLLDNCVISK